MSARILIPFSGDSVGGSHISSALIAKNLSEEFRPLFILSENSQRQKNLLEQHGLPYEIRTDLYVPHSLTQMILHAPRFVKALVKARTFLKENDIALIHCDNGPAQYLWFYAGAMAGLPYIHVQRNPLRMTPERRAAMRRASAVIANSRFTQATLPTLPEHVVQQIIPPLVELPENATRTKRPPPTVIGFLSNMQRRKRPELFLEIARILKHRAPGRFRFIMAGAFYEDYESRLRTLAQSYGLENDITFTGFVTDPHATLAEFDALVAPAENEAFGRVLIEAMALRVPVIAAASGGHLEIVEEGVSGFLCPPGDAQAFADRILELEEDAAMRRSILDTAAAESRKYEAAAITRRFEEIYRAVLRKEKSA